MKENKPYDLFAIEVKVINGKSLCLVENSVVSINVIIQPLQLLVEKSKRMFKRH